MVACVGPAEDLPRDMSHFEFVSHAPCNYFKPRGHYTSQTSSRCWSGDRPLLGCVWTSLDAAPSIECLVSGDHGPAGGSGDEMPQQVTTAAGSEPVAAQRRSASFRDKTRSAANKTVITAAGFTRLSKDR